MERNFPVITIFRNFRPTSRGTTKISKRNFGKCLFHSLHNPEFPEFLVEWKAPRKNGITGKFRSIRPFLLGPSFSEPGNRNSTWLILKLLNIILVRYQAKDRNILLQRYCSGLASQALVSSAKIQELPYVKCEHNRSNEQLATLELVRKIERYRKCSRGLLLNSYDRSDIVTLT